MMGIPKIPLVDLSQSEQNPPEEPAVIVIQHCSSSATTNSGVSSCFKPQRRSSHRNESPHSHDELMRLGDDPKEVLRDTVAPPRRRSFRTSNSSTKISPRSASAPRSRPSHPPPSEKGGPSPPRRSTSKPKLIVNPPTGSSRPPSRSHSDKIHRRQTILSDGGSGGTTRPSPRRTIDRSRSKTKSLLDRLHRPSSSPIAAATTQETPPRDWTLSPNKKRNTRPRSPSKTKKESTATHDSVVIARSRREGQEQLQPQQRRASFSGEGSSGYGSEKVRKTASFSAGRRKSANGTSSEAPVLETPALVNSGKTSAAAAAAAATTTNGRRHSQRVQRLQNKAAILIQTKTRQRMAHKRLKKKLIKADYMQYAMERKQQQERKASACDYREKIRLLHQQTESEVLQMRSKLEVEKRTMEPSIRKEITFVLEQEAQLRQALLEEETSCSLEESKTVDNLKTEERQLIAEKALLEAMILDAEKEGVKLQMVGDNVMTVFASLHGFVKASVSQKIELEKTAQDCNKMEVNKIRQKVRIVSSAAMVETAAKNLYRSHMYTRVYDSQSTPSSLFEELMHIVHECEQELGSDVLDATQAKEILEHDDSDSQCDEDSDYD